jgi:hypothetical protein
MDMVMGLPSYFFISNMSWLLPIVFELLCISLLPELIVSDGMKSWNELEMFE